MRSSRSTSVGPIGRTVSIAPSADGHRAEVVHDVTSRWPLIKHVDVACAYSVPASSWTVASVVATLPAEVHDATFGVHDARSSA